MKQAYVVDHWVGLNRLIITKHSHQAQAANKIVVCSRNFRAESVYVFNVYLHHETGAGCGRANFSDCSLVLRGILSMLLRSDSGLFLSDTLASYGVLDVLLLKVIWERSKSTLSEQQIDLLQSLLISFFEDEIYRRYRDLDHSSAGTTFCVDRSTHHNVECGKHEVVFPRDDS